MITKRGIKGAKGTPKYEVCLVKYLDGRKSVLHITSGKVTEKIILH